MPDLKAGAEGVKALAETPAFRYALRFAPRPLPRGMVLATCEMRTIVAVEDLTDQLDLPFDRRGDDRLLAQFQFGDFSPGRFAWVLGGICPLAAPVPAKGALSLWQWDGGPCELSSDDLCQTEQPLNSGKMT